jgi:uncharacterized protein YjbJ (UPF0337 family)
MYAAFMNLLGKIGLKGGNTQAPFQARLTPVFGRKTPLQFEYAGNSLFASRKAMTTLTPMKSSTKNRIKGAGRAAKGRVKEAAGKATRSQRMQTEGRIEKGAGRVQNRVGKVQRDFESAED